MCSSSMTINANIPSILPSSISLSIQLFKRDFCDRSSDCSHVYSTFFVFYVGVPRSVYWEKRGGERGCVHVLAQATVTLTVSLNLLSFCKSN